MISNLILELLFHLFLAMLRVLNGVYTDIFIHCNVQNLPEDIDDCQRITVRWLVMET